MKSIVRIAIAVLALGLFTGCGNSDGSLSLNQSQTAGLVQSLGTYEGPAHAEEIMGAMMTGIWKATFYQDESGALKCECSLQLHDEQNGWGEPTTAVVDVKIYNDSGNGEYNGKYSIRVEGAFSDNEPHWTIDVDNVSLTAGNPVSSITLFDEDSNQITLSRK